MNNTDDKQLLIKIKAGSLEAYEQLFNKYYKPLTAQAYYILNDLMEAEDLVQNLFVHLWREKIFNNIHQSLKGYLYRTVHNRCLNLLAKEKVREQRLSRFVYMQESAIIEQTLEKKETKKLVDEMLSFLPKQRQEAFYLVHLEDKKYHEVADEMGISVNTVKTHLRLALKFLQKKSRFLK